MKDQSNRDLDELIREAMERDAKRIPLRINRQTVVLVAERNFNAEYRKKKALQFEEDLESRLAKERCTAKHKKADAEEIARLQEEGMPIAAIADRMGVSTSTVRKKLKEIVK